jgi:hypothetical protein
VCSAAVPDGVVEPAVRGVGVHVRGPDEPRCQRQEEYESEAARAVC